MFTEAQVVVFVGALLSAISGAAGIIYRDGRAAVVACKTDCERERADDAKEIAELKAELREVKASSLDMAKAAIDAMTRLAPREGS